MFDVAIIGAGVNGSLLARKLSQFELNVIVLEKGNDIANGSSRANSAVVHAGYDPEPNTLKAKLNVSGAKMMEALCKELDVPYKKYPTIVVAFAEDQIKALYDLKERGEINGVDNIKIIDKNELKRIEPLIRLDKSQKYKKDMERFGLTRQITEKTEKQIQYVCNFADTKKVPEPLYKIPGTFQIPDVGKISGRSIR